MSRTVLVADDSPTIQRVVQLAFAEEADIDVVAVSSGSEAIEQIAARRPDLVLADTSMAGQTGYDVAESIKDQPVDDRIPVVLLTGAFEPVDETRAREAGCKTVLVKPFEPATLVSTVRELLGPSSEPLEPPPAPVLEITDELVDRVATEVIARLSDRIILDTTREVVGLTAERLVGEEIARIKDKLR